MISDFWDQQNVMTPDDFIHHTYMKEEEKKYKEKKDGGKRMSRSVSGHNDVGVIKNFVMVWRDSLVKVIWRRRLLCVVLCCVRCCVLCCVWHLLVLRL